MRRPVDHTDLAAVGYFSDWAPRPGATGRFHLSTTDAGARLRVVRLDRAVAEPVSWPVAETGQAVGIRMLDPGSWLEIRMAPDLLPAEGWSLGFELRLTDLPAGRPLLSVGAWTLGFDAGGRLSGTALPLGRWLDLRLTWAGGTMTLVARESDRAVARWESPLRSLDAPKVTTIRIGRDGDGAMPGLNASIAGVTIADLQNRICAAWSFPATSRPTRLPSYIDGGAELLVHNAPSFAMRSKRWTDRGHDPAFAPEHYDAVTLHDDDLIDAGWPATHEIAIPGDAESGVYAVEVSASGETTRWPFFVVPRARQANLAFLVPTFSYLAYADERLPPELYPWLCDDAGHSFARANGLTSLYDRHNDGAGVSLAGFRRPLATIRDDYLYPLCGAAHLLPVDLQLLRFLHAQGIRVDLLTDADLDREGEAALAGYRGLVTGSHPEYWSGSMLDALAAFQARGGHCAYLGGNGCYWVTAHDAESASIEVRRGLSGIRTWSSEPGETALATTGEPGGLWRHRGRAEHKLLGIGLAAMGFSAARPYRRTQESYAADLTWLFDGVGDAPIGAQGRVLGGAAGYEIDRRNARWGTPPQTIVLAVAEGFDSGYVADPDAVDPDHPQPVFGEMVLTRHDSGALTFAAGSVSWCGALPDSGEMNGEMNAVGLITRNLLQRIAS